MDEATNHRSTGYGGFIDTRQAERIMYLMKCPALVSRSLQPPSSDGSSRHVAKLIISIDPLQPEEDKTPPQFSMEFLGSESGFAPKHYAMDMAAEPGKFTPMCAFSESTQGKISCEGKILNKLDMRPIHDNMDNYRKLCRERTKKYTTKSRQIQVIDNDTGSHMRPMPGMIIPTGFTEKRKAPTKGSEMKRTRRDRGEMEDIMFKLFERQSNWTLRQLIQETDQPEQFLKDILKELCVYNNKGTNQGSYELKPEYKKHDDEPNS
ncbi:general transcription factor IIF subunit 2-like [Mangifera indica]|uniref:general transcription factor IIF subunit 2-like n=1 Tax=Mangifera indica TaxID=29780 RepID=UPI001CFAA13F|nr:general transcription factor IIF subunit 2-like [Mangifera indica]